MMPAQRARRGKADVADGTLAVERAPLGRYIGSHRRKAPRSQLASAMSEQDVLFNRDGIVVVPSWLEVDGQASFSIRSIVRLFREEYEPPRTTARVVFLVAVVLAMISVLHVINASLPPTLAWSALVASVLLACYSAWLGFLRASECRLLMAFSDGSRRRLELPDKQTLNEVHRALSLAMERQRGWQ